VRAALGHDLCARRVPSVNWHASVGGGSAQPWERHALARRRPALVSCLEWWNGVELKEGGGG